MRFKGYQLVAYALAIKQHLAHARVRERSHHVIEK